MTGEFLVVTGNGKGKTTFALSLCIEAAGAGKKVFLNLDQAYDFVKVDVKHG